jgi:leucyl aminopeptidase
VVALIGKGVKDSKSDRLEGLRKLGSQLASKFNAEKAQEINLSNPKNGLGNDEYLALLEGMILGNYQFIKYKSKKEANSLKTVNLMDASPKEAEIKELMNVCESTLLTRDLVNEPVIYLNTTQLSKEITKLSRKTGFSSRILSKAEITKMKMGGLLGVNRGGIRL